MKVRRPRLYYERLGLRFLDALERGDLDAVAAYWRLAGTDAALDRLLRWLLLRDAPCGRRREDGGARFETS